MTTLKQGMRGEDVKILQEALNSRGFDCGKADGIFGAKTGKAVLECQRKAKLTADALAGKKTCTYLGILEKIEAAQKIPEGETVELKSVKDFKQLDEPWANKSYPPSKNWTKFKDAACGCITACLCVDYYGLYEPNESLADMVYRVAEDATKCGARCKDAGTSKKIFERDGLNYKTISKSGVEKAINAGHPVAVCVKAGWSTYKGKGHWVLIVGYNDGYYIVRDVGSRSAARCKVKKADYAYVKTAVEVFKM